VRELVVVSGKGGTGKTSVAASFAVLAERAVIADCDVDAADLHLVLDPSIQQTETFSGGKKARVDPGRCSGCGRCEEVCRFSAISIRGASAGRSRTREVDEQRCEGCGACRLVCPSGAIELRSVINGEWFVSDSRAGTFVHARLGIAEDNSGKLVTLVRNEARRMAAASGAEIVLIDGSPGIGCPVIASITGADLALIVTEPTRSGMHDLKRIAEVAARLGTPTMVCLNKWDLNPDVAAEMEEWCKGNGTPVAGRVPYDRSVTDAQMAALAVVEHSSGPAAVAVRALWSSVSDALGSARAWDAPRSVGTSEEVGPA
jgi:MinD superfamily P-loop ATPase